MATLKVVATSPNVVAAPALNRTFNYYYRQPNWVWQYAEPTFYGSCAAVNNQIIQNNCLIGTQAVSVGGNGCTCYDPATQWTGCNNTANGVCRVPIPVPPVPIVVQTPWFR